MLSGGVLGSVAGSVAVVVASSVGCGGLGAGELQAARRRRERR